jgi:hypothetical protein
VSVLNRATNIQSHAESKKYFLNEARALPLLRNPMELKLHYW